jgi:hypothetical protein
LLFGLLLRELEVAPHKGELFHPVLEEQSDHGLDLCVCPSEFKSFKKN